MTTLNKDIYSLKNLLNKKRSLTQETFTNGNLFDEYDVFLLNFYSNLCKNDENHLIQDSQKFETPADEIQTNSSYLLHNLKKYVLNEKEKSKCSEEGKKIVGLSPEQIFNLKRYQMDLKNMPKFSNNFDKLSSEIEYSGSKTRIYMQLDSGFESKHRKKLPTLSLIERQNTEALRSIEEKRLKFKHLPKANKEKMDNNNLHKHWNWIAKKEIPKMYRVYLKYKNDIDYNCKKFSTFAQKEVKKKVGRVQRLQKEYSVRARKLHKEMLVFWRKRDKEIGEIKKKKEKIENEKKKKEDELQEMIIQKKRLEYLMKQSDIYSFFMLKNMGIDQVDQAEQAEQPSVEEEKKQHTNPNAASVVIGSNEVQINTKTNKVIFQSIKVDIDESAAREGVKNLIKNQREKMMKFDQQTNKIRETLGGDAVRSKKFEDLKDQDMHLDKPEISNQASLLIEPPEIFRGDLKEYQLKGLRWLDNLYDQGINGILADEMGLGKTIQAISFLAHLAEAKNNWGPFLVVSPNATLYNWQQELNKFCPSLKVLPYWGGLKERKTLRKFFNSLNLYTKGAAFHVCVTSYQLVVSDDKVFNRVNWQYMVLDEAQAIKNINSQRWNTLLSFNCRNRLLLSGTPIQNSMSELWALLHFIMPNLFDSHEQFQEWFSKDIEAHSQEKGELNQEQLNRLHKILKPFMLRRVKKDVENEIGPKIEYEILCEMTERQKILYNSIKKKLSNISDLFTSVDSKLKVENLMNLVMQFRKVCNHPELFERNLGKVPFIFRNLEFNRTSTFVSLPSTLAELRCDGSNCIEFTIPKLIYDEAYLTNFTNRTRLYKYSVFEYFNLIQNTNFSGLFNFLSLLDLSVGEFLNLIKVDPLVSQITMFHLMTKIHKKIIYSENHREFSTKFESINQETTASERLKFNSLHYSKAEIYDKPAERISIFINKGLFASTIASSIKNTFSLPHLTVDNIIELKQNIYKPLSKHRFYIPKVNASPIKLHVSSCRVKREQNMLLNNLTVNKLLYGNKFSQYKEKEITPLINNFNFPSGVHYQDSYLQEELDKGLMTELFYQNEGYTQIELPSFERLVADCAKLKKLDELLIRLKKENHRVLIFCQMTRMLDILEEYMAKRRYTYFRMDGSTNIADRRDMVNEFQINRKIFAFLLSTRAGGLGVNLTGADTVIFYDNDWNPTMDAQATDRAHRIGQTKVVSVYRLITKGTIEERILKRAKQKQNVQTTVYAGGAFKADIFKQSEIVELLYSEEEVKKMEMEKKRLLEVSHNLALENKMMVEKNSEITITDKKKKGKKGEIKEKKKKNKVEIKDEEQTNTSIIKPQHPRNIFAVSNSAPQKQKIEALKVDS